MLFYMASLRMFTVMSVSVYTYIYHTHFNSYVFSGINIPQQIYLCLRNAHFAGFVHLFFFFFLASTNSTMLYVLYFYSRGNFIFLFLK